MGLPTLHKSKTLQLLVLACTCRRPQVCTSRHKAMQPALCRSSAVIRPHLHPHWWVVARQLAACLRAPHQQLQLLQVLAGYKAGQQVLQPEQWQRENAIVLAKLGATRGQPTACNPCCNLSCMPSCKQFTVLAARLQ